MSYSIDKSSTLIRVTYTGTLENRDIEGVLEEAFIMNSKELNLINRIEDMRKLNGIRIGFDDLMSFTENLRKIQLPQKVKSAILTNNSLQYGIARMFQTILENPQMDIQIFTHEEEALHWLSTAD